MKHQKTSVCSTREQFYTQRNKKMNKQKEKQKEEPSIMLSRYAEWLEVYRRVLKPPKF